MKKRQKDILQALKDLGGTATTREIGKKTGLNNNGISQTMGQSLGPNGFVICLGGHRGYTKWKIVKTSK